MYKFELVLNVILFIICILYIAKILFELSLGISRFTNFIDIGHLITLLVIVVTKVIEVAMKANKEFNMTDASKFQDFSFFVSIEEINEVALATCSFFYPFKIFQYLAHFKFFNPAKTIINTFSRIAPGILVLFICYAIMFLSWGMAVFILLSPDFPEFSTYLKSLFALFSIDFLNI